jgi:hypothetical protein
MCENTHDKSFIKARHESFEAYSSLTDVTSLTGPADWSDRSDPANCSSQLRKEGRKFVEDLLMNMCFQKDLMGSCTDGSKKF